MADINKHAQRLPSGGETRSLRFSKEPKITDIYLLQPNKFAAARLDASTKMYLHPILLQAASRPTARLAKFSGGNPI